MNKLRAVTAVHVNRKVSEVVEEMNPTLRGWVNYFCIGHSASVFNEVREYALQRVLRLHEATSGEERVRMEELVARVLLRAAWVVL